MNLLRNGNGPRKATMFDLSLKKRVVFFMLYTKEGPELRASLLEFSDSIAQSSHFCNARIN